jgi:predicted P-loop ATPase
MEIVLNIFGGQGIGKSLFFRALCPNPRWFTDSIQDSIVSGGQNNRDELMKLHGKIIVEMPELSPVKSGGKSADDKLKQFISTQEDNMRLPYGHDSIDCPRTCALAGTSNNRDVYRDSTGARRFVSIDHGNVSIKLGDQANGVLALIRRELWGEVARSFQPGELSSYGSEVSGFGGELLVAVPPQLRLSQSTINDSHRFEEIGIQDVMEWMQDKTRVSWGEIVTFAKTVPGLRDAKESMIMAMVRKLLSNDPSFEFKKRITRHDEEGKKQKMNCWVNMNLQIEKDHQPGVPVPEHWSKLTGEPGEKPEY